MQAGHYRRAVVAVCVSEAIKASGLPYHRFLMETPYRQTHLLVSSNDGKTLFGLSQMKRKEQFPRRSRYRDQMIRRNPVQLGFDFEIDPPLVMPREESMYFVITHGDQGGKPEFVGVGLPNQSRLWAEWKDILSMADFRSRVPEETIEQRVPMVMKIPAISGGENP